MARKFNEIKLRAIDLERLGIQVSFVYADDAETLQQCRDNAQRLADTFFPVKAEPKYLKYDTDELYDADPNCDHKVLDAPGGGVKCTQCRGWFCF